jgi:hypothetical protein
MAKVIAVILAISVAVVWAGGCQEEQASSGDKTIRLLDAENKDLQTQLQNEKKKRDDAIANLNAEVKNRDNDIRNLKTLLRDEADKRENEVNDLVAQCQAEINKQKGTIETVRTQLGECAQTKQDQLQAEADKQCKDSISAVNEWNKELQEEVERLKAELAKAKVEEKK